MTLQLTLAWWHLPTALTVLALLWAFLWPANDGGLFGGLTRLFMLLPALVVVLIAWIVAGALK